jgi:hypothetical protein
MTAMSPAEVMAKAEFLDECGGGDWEQYKVKFPVPTHNRIRNMRAALRAFAEMEPTQGMENAYVTVGHSIGKDRAWADEPYAPTRSYILAAAEEGEKA